MSNIAKLKNCLSNMPAGPIEDIGKLEDLLVASWGELDGANQGGMEADKLSGRVEEIQWNPPILTFHIERHGGTMMGSTRAELQDWTVDVERGVARFSQSRFRQIEPRAIPVDVKPIAEEIAKAIVNRREDERLKWSDLNKVRVRIGMIFSESSAVKQTLQGRQKRFRQALSKRLEPYGWVPGSTANTFVRQEDTEQ